MPDSIAPRWLSVVGIGEDGVEGLGAAAQRAIASAAIVFGGRRHLALAAPLITGEARAWPVPFDSGLSELREMRGQRLCVLASGDPFHFGVGVTLAHHLDPAEMAVFPAPSAFSLAAARLGWGLQDVETVSLHGRPIDLLRQLLHPGRRIIALTSDGAAPTAIAALMTALGFGASRLHILEAMGGPAEVHHTARAEALGSGNFHPLNALAIEVEAAPEARILPLGFGLSDDLFEHDGQITKREIRAMTLAALSPRRGELLWDIGAGSGSIGIEWMLNHPSLRAIAIEAREDRAARARRNAAAFGTPGLTILTGKAPEALAGLPSPDAIFIGGGGSQPGVVDAALAALRPGGRLVANAVTLEMEAVLLALYRQYGGELRRIGIARASAVGSLRGWREGMPVTQWAWVK
ncbi:precorrin-6y C5,15-methyltransferase (decarboxylating) subunit CbiE [Acetobacteraceae bacterium H6797]|nr:precorrin-6y C5,15-methyltransferase (decarboxylating) subunit CbiE [Acetobacteraceae bacterium H6797]